ncbi:MAG TPA: Xaa-Pro peptidase family protein [Bacteroidota bacterium]|nr:Xaa-Pro peptidase family protein [Bacteroidota bacterium]
MFRRQFIKSAAAAGAITTLSASTLYAQQQKGRIPKETLDPIKSRIKPISADERLERVERAKELMAEQHIDALFMEGGTTLGYFTGAGWGRSERLFAMIIPRKGDPQYIAPKFEEARAQEQVGTSRLLTWEEHESPYALVHQILTDAGALTGTIAIEETTRQFVTEGIAQSLSSVRLVSGTSVTAGCRSVKSAHEIELMQIANDMTMEVYKAAVPQLKEGMKEQEFGGIISGLFREFGVGGGALVLFGEAAAYPHGTVKEHTLKEGQPVLIDGGCSVEGYASDITRMAAFGTPSEKMVKVFSIVRDAQSAALAAAKPGAAAEDIDAAARKVIVDAGYGPDYKYFTHRLGHGIGLEGHEWYYLVRGNKRKEEPGNTHSNEPGIYIPGEFGVRLEDEMLITDSGAKLLLPQSQSFDKMF